MSGFSLCVWLSNMTFVTQKSDVILLNAISLVVNRIVNAVQK